MSFSLWCHDVNIKTGRMHWVLGSRRWSLRFRSVKLRNSRAWNLCVAWQELLEELWSVSCEVASRALEELLEGLRLLGLRGASTGASRELFGWHSHLFWIVLYHSLYIFISLSCLMATYNLWSAPSLPPFLSPSLPPSLPLPLSLYYRYERMVKVVGGRYVVFIFFLCTCFHREEQDIINRLHHADCSSFCFLPAVLFSCNYFCVSACIVCDTTAKNFTRKHIISPASQTTDTAVPGVVLGPRERDTQRKEKKQRSQKQGCVPACE